MLKNIQQQFLNVILNQSNDVSFISSTHADKRLDIYRQTIVENVRNSLSIMYPGIWQLLGKTCADNLAKAFVLHFKNLPNSGCFDDFGYDFPKFLGQIPELNHLYYISDYAEYESNLHQLYGKKDCASIDIITLQNLSSSELDTLCFKWIDACIPFFSKYPLDLIKTTLSEESSSSINLPPRASYAILARVNHQLITYWIEQDLWMFIDYLHKGFSLEKTLKKINQQFLNFDLSYALYFIFEKKLVKSLKY